MDTDIFYNELDKLIIFLKQFGYTENAVGALEKAKTDRKKLENINKFLEKYQETLNIYYSGNKNDSLESDVLRDIISEINKKED